MTLFVERGYDAVTTAEIAAAAGLTERTFFRYFVDKREVLFGGSAILRDFLVASMATSPHTETPLSIVREALSGLGVVFDASRWDFANARERLITASADLQERELIKRAALAAVIADELRLRGLPDTEAMLTADLAMVLFHSAFQRWIRADASVPFAQHVLDTVAELNSIGAQSGTKKGKSS